MVLILGLLYVYGANLRKVQSLFTGGLFVFAALFLIQNAIALYFSITMMPYYAPGLESYMLVFTLLQTAAFAFMNIITWK